MTRLKTAAYVIAVALAALAWSVAPASTQTRSGEIYVDLVSGGLIVGLSGGSGTLVYRGRQYPLSIGGVSIGVTIGASSARLAGRVYNLRRISDIEGTYHATDAAYALIAGRRAARLINSRGVVLVLRGRQIGLEATVDVSGMRVLLR